MYGGGMKTIRPAIWFLLICLISSEAHAVNLLGGQRHPMWHPQSGLTWDIQFTGVIKLNPQAEAYDVDLFDTPANAIAAYKAEGHRVICYMSVGSFEDWRPDADSFPKVVRGLSNGWPGENWLDIRNVRVMGPIMEARMDLAVQKGCDAIDADNVDGYLTHTGFPLTPENQFVYNRGLALMAHQKGLAIALKNDLLQVEDLEPFFDMAINESCFDFNECAFLQPFVDNNKPVLAIEYQDNDALCDVAGDMGFSLLIKDVLLSRRGIACRDGFWRHFEIRR